MRQWFEDPVRRLLAMIGALIVLLVTAIGVTVWRYDSAIDADHSALGESQVQTATQAAGTALAEKGGLVDAYGGDKDPEDLAGIERADKDFHAALERAGDGLDDADELATLEDIAAAEAALDPLFDEKVKPVAGTPDFDQGVKPYTAALDKVSTSLERFAAAEEAEAAEAAASARSEADSARTIALIAGALAVLLAVMVAIYCRRLVRRL